MTNKKIFRTLLVTVLAVAMMASLCTGALALGYNGNTLVFQLKELKPDEVKDVVIHSSTSDTEYLVSEVAPWLFDEYSPVDVAFYVANDLAVKGCDWDHEERIEEGQVVFTVAGPTFVLVPSEFDCNASKIDATAIAIDVPDDTEVTVIIGKGESALRLPGVVKDGVVKFTVPGAVLDGVIPGDTLQIYLEYTLDGKDYSVGGKYGVVSGKIEGESKKAEDEPKKDPEKPGDDKSSLHGISIGIGSGKSVVIRVDEDHIFDKVDTTIEDSQQGLADVEIGNFHYDVDVNVPTASIIEQIIEYFR